MIRCRETETFANAYVDGDLDPARTSAVRGHLRSCANCKTMIDELARVVDAASELDPIDPPGHLWQQISDRIGDREVADASRSRLWFWWQDIKPVFVHASIAAAVTAVAIVWYTRPGTPEEERQNSALVDTRDDKANPPDDGANGPEPTPGDNTAANSETFAAVRNQEIADTAAFLGETRAELEAMIGDMQQDWSPDIRLTYDTKRNEFRALENRLLDDIARADEQTQNDPRAIEPLFLLYREEIAYLQSVVLAGDDTNELAAVFASPIPTPSFGEGDER